jgi:surface antigen/peptidoglycan hydrolase CwlO-like protein
LVVAVAVLVLGVGTIPRLVTASTCSNSADCQAQISKLNSQNAAAQQSLGQLTSQAASFQDTINQLQAQISALQQLIDANLAKQQELQAEIDKNQAELDRQRALLGQDIKAMYIDGQPSSIEMLATSKSLSDFVDKQEYRTSVQNKIQDTVKKINELQAQLKTQKTEVDDLVSTEQSENAQLASTKAQQQQMLNYNKSQQATYNQQIASNRSNISSLYARLAALNNVSGQSIIMSGTCGGGYPATATSNWGHWGCNYPQDNTYDNWAMYNRECVSYGAYMMYTVHGRSAYGWGNAYQWINAARNAGYRVDQTPEDGAIAVRGIDYNTYGDVGHVMYVDSANGDGTITVEEYNQHYNGTYDMRTFNPSSYANRGGLYYIHF